ncbi:MAG: hypothetical protein ACFCBW_10300, partial [Candidatus Competibacterales bacterium]
MAFWGAIVATTATAQTPSRLDRFKAWDAYVLDQTGGRICYMLTVPTDQAPKNVRRGEVYFLVTHRPAQDIRDEVSVITGY